MKPDRNSYPRGTTLVELIVACAVVGLVLAATLYLVTACYRYYVSNDAAVTLNDRVLSCSTRMHRELRDGNAGSCRLFTAPAGIVFASPRRADSSVAFDPDSLQPLWAKWICYYLEPQGTEFLLIRKEEYWPSTADTPPPVPDSRSTAYFQSLGGGSVLARGVKELTFEAGPPLSFELLCQEVGNPGTSSQSEFEMEVKTQVAFRN